MRFVYMDEAGISAGEPVTVVAGVVIDSDRQFRILEKYIKNLIDDFVPMDKRKDFAFHAKELANGGKTFIRNEYPDDRRLLALRRMASIPRRFLLPMVLGWERKSTTERVRQNRPEKQRLIDSHVMAHVQCMIAADQYVRKFARPDEIAICVAENNNEARDAIRRTHTFLYEKPEEPITAQDDDLPVQRIVDTIHFAMKSEAILLQIADTVAYVSKRFINGAQGSELLMELMVGSKVSRDAFDAPAGYQIIVPYIDDKVVNQQAWYASNNFRTQSLQGK